MQRLLAGKAKNLMHTVLFFCQQNYCKNSATVEPRSSRVEPCQEDSFESNSVKSLCRYCIPLWNYASEHQLISILHRLPSKNHFRTAVSQSLLWYITPIFTILTKHQTWAPVSPMLLLPKSRFVRAELCFSPSANAWQQTKICKIRGEIRSNIQLTFTYSQEISTPSTAFFSYFRSYSHIMWSPMKWNEQAQIHSQHDGHGWTWHISAPILCMICMAFLSLSSPFHLRCSSVWIHIALPPPHDRFLSILTILTKHQAWAPSGPTLLVSKFRFVRAELCFSPSAKAWQQTKICKMWWNHENFYWNSHKRNLNAFYRMLSYFRSYWHIMSMWSPMKWKEQAQISLRSAWWTWHISAPILCIFFLSLSSPFHLRLALSRSLLQYLFPHAHHPHPNTKPEPRYHQCCCNANPGLSGPSCASVLLPMPDSRQRSANYVVKFM